MNIVAIDIGLKRIGLAFATDKTPAVVCNPIFRKNRDQASNDVSIFLKEKMANILVVGLSKGGASEDEMERRVRHFVSLLNFDGEVFYQDEYGTSVEASSFGFTKKDGKVDSVAAMLILDRFLSSQQYKNLLK